MDTTPIDTAVLHAHTGRDIALAHELLKLFVDQATAIAERLNAAATAPHTPVRLSADLHLLKGSALAIGAGPIVKAVDTLESVLDPCGSGAARGMAMAALRHAIALACEQATRIIEPKRR